MLFQFGFLSSKRDVFAGANWRRVRRPMGETPMPQTVLGRREPRGAIFVAALGVTVVLSGLLLVFAQEMRTEAIASANRVADAQAAAVEQAAEQWVLAQLENETDPLVMQQMNSQGLFVGSTDSASTSGGNTGVPNSTSGGGYFWIIRPNPDSTTEPLYGIVDENSKLNINMATVEMLERLPGITTEMANSIVEWRGGNATQGAGSMYYGSLADPYSVKNSDFETLDELLLIKDMTPEILYGLDRNRDGVLSDSESTGQLSTVSSSSDGVPDDGRGIAQYLTAWSRDTQTTQTQGGAPGVVRSTTTTVQHRINANTASRGVLIALGFTSNQADGLIGARSTTASDTNQAWIQSAASGAPATATAQLIANSQQFSADIVAVSADGRGYRRVKIVVETASTPHTIIYRKDLSSLGFPLPPEVRENLRAGRGVTGVSEGVVSR